MFSTELYHNCLQGQSSETAMTVLGFDTSILYEVASRYCSRSL